MEYHEKIEYIEKMFGDKINDDNIKIFYRFWQKVDIKDDIKECWNWIESINNKGYGLFYLYGNKIICRKIPAHRMAYILIKGSIPDGLEVQHACNNRIL